MVLEVLGFAGPARGPEVESQKSYSTGSVAESLGSFEQYTFFTSTNERRDVLCSRIYVNKSSTKDTSPPKVILRYVSIHTRPLCPDLTYFMLHLIRVFQPLRSFFRGACSNLVLNPTPEAQQADREDWNSAFTFSGRTAGEKCSRVWSRVQEELGVDVLYFGEFRHWMVKPSLTAT